MFSLGLVGILFGVYFFLKNPQVISTKLLKESARASHRDLYKY
jgi:hypothetical protein